MSGQFYLVLTIGQGANKALETSEESQQQIRELVSGSIQHAFAVSARVLPSGMYASVGPSCVMLAFEDSSSLRLSSAIEAIKARLDYLATVQDDVPRLSAAVTCGYMTEIDALGFSKNFEGLPAIAGARILKALPQFTVAVGEPAWGFPELVRGTESPVPIEGKHPGELFRVRLRQWRDLDRRFRPGGDHNSRPAH